MKKIILVTILSTVMLFVSVIIEVNAQNYEYSEEFTQKQQIQAYKWAMFNEMLFQAQNDILFEKIFGGVYFEDTALVINIVSGYEDNFRFSYNPGVEYRENIVKYSLNELEEIKEILIQKFLDKSISQIYIDVVNNRLAISTELSYAELYDRIGKYIDFDMLTVTSQNFEMDYNINYTVNGHPYTILGSGCTVGFAAKDSSGNPGFVTAGHCIVLSGASTGTNVYYDGLHAGDVSSGWHFEIGDVDGAFIKLRYPLIGTKWLPTKNLIFGGSYFSVGTYSSYYAVGTLVAFHGTFGANNTTNTSVEYGQILENGIMVLSDECILYDDMFRTNIATHPGDSGGPVTITIYIGEGIYETNVIGVLSFYNTYYGSYFSKASDILGELSLTAY